MDFNSQSVSPIVAELTEGARWPDTSVGKSDIERTASVGNVPGSIPPLAAALFPLLL